MIENMQVRVINHSKHPLPKYETTDSAGMDLRASLEDTRTLMPGDRTMVPTGLFLELPKGFEAQIRPRSGLAIKHGITVLNSPGTIDADYRGELKVLLINHGDEEFEINDGERIAQMLISRHETINWDPVEALTQSARGEGGFGSSGQK